jgi:hypothetical protein
VRVLGRRSDVSMYQLRMASLDGSGPGLRKGLLRSVSFPASTTFGGMAPSYKGLAPSCKGMGTCCQGGGCATHHVIKPRFL